MGGGRGYQDPRTSYATSLLYGAAPAAGKRTVKYHNPTSNADEMWDWGQQYGTYKTGLTTQKPGARAMPYGLWRAMQLYDPASSYSGWWTPRYGQQTPTPATIPGGSPGPTTDGRATGSPTTPPVTGGTNTNTTPNVPQSPGPGWTLNPVTGQWDPPRSAGGLPLGGDPNRRLDTAVI